MRARLFSALLIVAWTGCGKRPTRAGVDAAAPMPADGAFVLHVVVDRAFGDDPTARALAHTEIDVVDDQLHFVERWSGAPHVYARPPADVRRRLGPDDRAQLERRLAESGLLQLLPGDAAAAGTFQLELRTKTVHVTVSGDPREERPEIRAAALLFSQLSFTARAPHRDARSPGPDRSRD